MEAGGERDEGMLRGFGPACLPDDLNEYLVLVQGGSQYHGIPGSKVTK